MTARGVTGTPGESRIGGHARVAKDDDAGRAQGSGQVRDARVVADDDAGPGQEGGQAAQAGTSRQVQGRATVHGIRHCPDHGLLVRGPRQHHVQAQGHQGIGYGGKARRIPTPGPATGTGMDAGKGPGLQARMAKQRRQVLLVADLQGELQVLALRWDAQGLQEARPAPDLGLGFDVGQKRLRIGAVVARQVVAGGQAGAHEPGKHVHDPAVTVHLEHDVKMLALHPGNSTRPSR